MYLFQNCFTWPKKATKEHTQSFEILPNQANMRLTDKKKNQEKSDKKIHY